MKVIVAENCGFCPGVRNAISMAEKVLNEERDVYCLGAIIHNKDVVERLARKGLKTVERIEDIRSGTVLIRSHGASPAQIEELKGKRVKIVDATCVLVQRVQNIAKSLDAEGYRVVVIGDANHPEVQGVVGCAKDVVVIAGIPDVGKLPKGGKLGIVCQTTKGPEFFGKVLGSIVEMDFEELRVINTLCKETVKRQRSAVEICRKVDVMFVLGGLESANTRTLAELCKKHNQQTFHLQNWAEFDRKIVFGKKTAGVTAGASTPDWIIKEFVDKLKAV